MTVLLMRLAGPMQSWGTQSRFSIRDTDREPSKSGVIGLLCAALGRSRDEPVDDLARLRMGVRVDQEGIVRVDYQTAGGTHRRDEKYGVVTVGGELRTSQSWRYYLADADFLVGLEGEDRELLRQLHDALAAPRWQIFLGRKAFPPGVPVWLADGLVEDIDLLTALMRYPWPRPGLPLPPPDRRPGRLRFVLEADPSSGSTIRRDQPVDAAFRTRRFALRSVVTIYQPLGIRGGVPLREE
jgi:CRISPR system Cascade subunit CasD